jgi:hypothetical protein
MNELRIFYLIIPDLISKSEIDLRSNPQICEALESYVNILESEGSLIKLTDESKKILQIFEENIRMLPMDNDENESFENKANDTAFNIVRVNNQPVEMLVYGTLQGLDIFFNEVKESGTNLSHEDWVKLPRASYSLLCYYLNKKPKPDSLRGIRPDKLNNFLGKEALKRWTSGHHYFMTIIQGEIYCTNNALRYLEENSFDKASSYFSLLVNLMEGAEGALKFTGEFDEDAYLNFIRPTLIPPNAPPGMSGLRWRDHEFLVRNLINLKPYFKNTNATIKDEVIRLKEALGKVYDAHKNVCKSFVHENTSLRSEKPAVDVIEGYKRARLHLFSKE